MPTTEEPTSNNMIKITHDVDGNPIYPVTSEEAIILRDGVMLSDRLDEFYSIRDVTDLITEQFDEMNQQSERINQLIDQSEQLTEDVLVFDDDLASTVDTGVESIDYQYIVQEINNEVSQINSEAVCHMDDADVRVPINTLYGQISDLKAEVRRLTNRITILEQCINNQSGQGSASGTTTSPEIMEELQRMNTIILGYADRIGQLEASSEFALVFQDEAITNSETGSLEEDLVSLRATLGDRKQLPAETDVISLLLEIKAQLDANNNQN